MRRSILILVVGAVVGYTLGYNDAYRGADALGARVSSLVSKAHPDRVREARQREAEQFRHATQQAADVPDAP